MLDKSTISSCMRHLSGFLIVAVVSLGLVAGVYGLNLTQEYRRDAADLVDTETEISNPTDIPIKFISFNVTDVTETSAKINWVATKAGWAKIEVGPDADHLIPQETPYSEISLAGSYTLSGLSSKQRYFIRVRLLTPAGQEALSEAYYFTTR